MKKKTFLFVGNLFIKSESIYEGLYLTWTEWNNIIVYEKW